MFETPTTNPGHPRRSTRTRPKERSKNGRHLINMNTQMGSSLPSKKLDWSNYSSWENKMNQFLVRQGHWSTTKPRRIAQQSRAKPRRHKAAKPCNKTASRRREESHEGAKPRNVHREEKPRSHESTRIQAYVIGLKGRMIRAKPPRAKPRREAAKKAASRTDADEVEGSQTGRWTPHT